MNFDVESHLHAVDRSVSSLERDGQLAHAVSLSRNFETSADDLWDAVTNGDRIPRWFLPITGNLVPGGRYQFEGNAGGTITGCEPQSHITLTWEFAGDVSWVDVRFSDGSPGQRRLTLTHTSLHSGHWEEYGPGAAGVGWEMGLLGLALHLADPTAPMPDDEEFATSSDGKAIMRGSSDAWGQASAASGTEPKAARAAAMRTTAFYTGEPAEPA